jgi:hypothetical protein
LGFEQLLVDLANPENGALRQRWETSPSAVATEYSITDKQFDMIIEGNPNKIQAELKKEASEKDAVPSILPRIRVI